MGEQVQFKKVDLPKLDTKPTFTIPTFTSKAPEIKLDGGSNWGVGDEVSFSGGGSVDELSDAQNATDSDDIAVVRQGLTDSQNVEQSPETTGVVTNAATMVDNGEGRVATDQAGVVEAEGEHRRPRRALRACRPVHSIVQGNPWQGLVAGCAAGAPE